MNLKKSKTYPLLTAIFMFFCLLSFSNSYVLAAKEDPKVYDNANLLSPEEVTKLESLCDKYGKKGKLDIVIVTINDQKLGDGELYLEQMYDTIGFGYDKEFGDTAMIIVDMSTREVIILGFGKAETYINNERGTLIRTKITPYLSQGNYNEAFTKYIKLSSRYMNINPQINPDNLFFRLWFQLLLAGVIGLVIVGAMAIRSGGKVTINDKTYLNHNDSKVLAQKDEYLRTTVTKIHKPKPTNTSGGSSSGGSSSGGHSHSSSRGGF